MKYWFLMLGTKCPSDKWYYILETKFEKCLVISGRTRTGIYIHTLNLYQRFIKF